ncbi:MAG: L-histidine N(alpha)-methyltransferase [Planctomycetes bacterium]|nr:L-histidine N(alpha)-methyltransferase [Planctomycetota bacterium]
MESHPRPRPEVPSSTDADREAFLHAAQRGLRRRPRTLPCRYFYDARGSALFEAICETPEYYPTRTELSILERHGADVAALLGPDVTLIELGSGSAVKTRLLIERLASPAAYVPVDISAAALDETESRHRADFPDVPVRPVHDDFTNGFVLPPLVTAARAGTRVVFFPGSTIGNFSHAEALLLMSRVAHLVREGGAFLVGVDLQKDVAVLEAAYNDAAGVTAAFNKNVLVRLRDELGADVDPDRFAHRAVWDATSEAIESYLVSDRAQTVTLAGERFEFARGETIHTESSHKYTLDGFAALAEGAGLRREACWTDDRRLFSVQLFRAVPQARPGHDA